LIEGHFSVSGSASIGIGLVRPDLLGTYGDSGNGLVLAQRLRWRGIPAELVSLGEGQAVPANVKVIVLGGGEDRALSVLLADLQLVANLNAAADRGVAMLGVCAGLQMLGKALLGPDGSEMAGAGLLDCTSYRLERRAVGECMGVLVDDDASHDDRMLTGFENHRGGTDLGSSALPLARMEVGVGNGQGCDGTVSGRVIGTYFHGPILARNPRLADRLLSSVLGELEPLSDDLIQMLRVERTSAAFRGAGLAQLPWLPSWRSRRN